MTDTTAEDDTPGERIQMQWAAFGWLCPVCDVTVNLPKFLGPRQCPAGCVTPPEDAQATSKSHRLR